VTRIKVPKQIDENLQWRVNLLRQAERDKGLQRDLYTAASLSLLLWVNTFAWTYRLFDIADDGTVQQCPSHKAHVPFITWQVQDRHLLWISDKIKKGRDGLTDKSRDMGATWDHIVALHHQWLFKQERNFLEISRKESAVDTLGTAGEAGSDPGTLFGKHDYLNKWLPAWMRPRYHRIRLHLVNLQNGSRIDGESANASAGSSDRRTAILLDEMAKMDEGEAIKRSTKDVTACRLANSTQNGPGTAYAKWRQSGQIDVFPLMYHEHPEKGRGRYVVENVMYPHLGPWLIRSPWFDKQEEERSQKEMAIEILADPIGSGETYFESTNIEAHRAVHMKPHKSRWKIDFKRSLSVGEMRKAIGRVQMEKVRSIRTSRGPLRVWVNLIDGRLDQTKTYILGIDISKGQGASNSVVSIMCVETREKVGEWADANTPPYDFARVACALALWVGGRAKNHRPFMIWEANGPGWDFGRQVVKTYGYPIYYRDKQVGTDAEKITKKYGWHSTRDKKDLMLGVLRRAYAHGGFVNHSKEALDEALTYIYYNGGGIGPASLTEESEAARKTHGDRVIADGLCLWAIEGKAFKKPTDEDKMPEHCAERRRQEHLRNLKRLKQQDSFDFRSERVEYADRGIPTRSDDSRPQWLQAA
jgi:hypothetical protein